MSHSCTIEHNKPRLGFNITLFLPNANGGEWLDTAILFPLVKEHTVQEFFEDKIEVLKHLLKAVPTLRFEPHLLVYLSTLNRTKVKMDLC